jgi:hypothetical protein
VIFKFWALTFIGVDKSFWIFFDKIVLIQLQRDLTNLKLSKILPILPPPPQGVGKSCF